MAEILFKNECAISLGTVESEEDLKTIPGVSNINPPPREGRCDCCGRHINELHRFGSPGEPRDWASDAYLVKRWRPEGPYDEEAEVAAKEARRRYKEEGFCDPLDWMIYKYGAEKGERLYYSDMLQNSIRPSWECRDCFMLNVSAYHEKLSQRYTTSISSPS